MPNWVGVVVMVGIAAAGFILTHLSNSKSHARIEGSFAKQVEVNTNDINDLKTAKGQMWAKINAHDYDLGRLKLHTKLPRNGE